MPYSKRITISDAMALDLFEDIKYKYIENYIHTRTERSYVIDIKITDIDYLKTLFCFKLDDKTYNVVKEFSGPLSQEVILACVMEESDDEDDK